MYKGIHALRLMNKIVSLLVNTQELIHSVVVSEADVLQNEIPKDN
jgi:hypothetical protein